MLSQFILVALVTLNKSKYLYGLTALRFVLCVLFDLFFVSSLPLSLQLGVNGIGFSNIVAESCEGYDLFTNMIEVERERKREKVALEVSKKYGKNALLRGINYLECSTQRERNTFIGGHRAGDDDKTGKS